MREERPKAVEEYAPLFFFLGAITFAGRPPLRISRISLCQPRLVFILFVGWTAEMAKGSRDLLAKVNVSGCLDCASRHFLRIFFEHEQRLTLWGNSGHLRRQMYHFRFPSVSWVFCSRLRSLLYQLLFVFYVSVSFSVSRSVRPTKQKK